jgi:hypothetical protein
MTAERQEESGLKITWFIPSAQPGSLHISSKNTELP